MTINKTLLILVVASLLAVAVGCHRIHDEIVGSGVRQTQQRTVPSFTSISTEGAFEVEVVCQKEQSLELEGDDNILPRVTTEVSNNVLHIRSRGAFATRHGIIIRIGVPSLEGINASGAGTINVRNVNNDNFEISVNGAPTINVAGEAKIVKVSANGAGKVDSHKLRASNVSVSSNGVSKVE